MMQGLFNLWNLVQLTVFVEYTPRADMVQGLVGHMGSYPVLYHRESREMYLSARVAKS